MSGSELQTAIDKVVSLETSLETAIKAQSDLLVANHTALLAAIAAAGSAGATTEQLATLATLASNMQTQIDGIAVVDAANPAAPSA